MNSKPLNVTVAESAPGATSSPANQPGLMVRILRTVAEVEEFRSVWTAWRGHRDSDIDFFLMLLESREEILHPYVVVVYRNGVPDAMMIGRLERRQLGYGVGYLHLFRAWTRIFTFQYGALRGNDSDENCAEIIRAILNSLKSGEADLALLDHPRSDSALYKRALSIPGFLSRDRVIDMRPRRMMRLPATMEEVYLGLSGKHRKHLKSEAKKLRAEFHLNTCCVRDVEELARITPKVEEVAKKTYQRGLGVGFEDTPRMGALLRLYAKKGWLRIYVLYAADTPIVFWIGAVYDGWFYSDCTGYDPHYRDYAPGAFLFVQMIEDFCREGLQGIDFGLGDADYKKRFSNESFEEATVYLFAPRAKGLLLNALHTATSAADIGIKRVLSRTQLLMKVKRLWRDRLAQKGAK